MQGGASLRGRMWLNHAWTYQHTIRWEETSVVDWASRRVELRLKEAFSIQLTPEGERFNRDEGMELPGFWAATIRAITRQGGQRSVRLPMPHGTTSDLDTPPDSTP